MEYPCHPYFHLSEQHIVELLRSFPKFIIIIVTSSHINKYLHVCKVYKGQDNLHDCGHCSSNRCYPNDGQADSFGWLLVHYPLAALQLAKSTCDWIRKEILSA